MTMIVATMSGLDVVIRSMTRLVIMKITLTVTNINILGVKTLQMKQKKVINTECIHADCMATINACMHHRLQATQQNHLAQRKMVRLAYIRTIGHAHRMCITTIISCESMLTTQQARLLCLLNIQRSLHENAIQAI